MGDKNKKPSTEQSKGEQASGTKQNQQGPISPQGPTSGSAKAGDRPEKLRESSSESGQ